MEKEINWVNLFILVVNKNTNAIEILLLSGYLNIFIYIKLTF